MMLLLCLVHVVPGSDDETNTDGETNQLFEDKLLPEQKAKISMIDSRYTYSSTIYESSILML